MYYYCCCAPLPVCRASNSINSTAPAACCPCPAQKSPGAVARSYIPHRSSPSVSCGLLRSPSGWAQASSRVKGLILKEGKKRNVTCPLSRRAALQRTGRCDTTCLFVPGSNKMNLRRADSLSYIVAIYARTYVKIRNIFAFISRRPRWLGRQVVRVCLSIIIRNRFFVGSTTKKVHARINRVFFLLKKMISGKRESRVNLSDENRRAVGMPITLYATKNKGTYRGGEG